jgi:glycosyltransferase involved in cell wall biosynthesis
LSRPAPKLKALHVASGDLWAGAEVQLFTLLTQFSKGTEVQPHAALLNDGELAQRLRAQNVDVTIFDEKKLNGLQIMLGLRSLMNACGPDIVHTHRQKENVLGSIANSLATRSSSVRTCHGAPEHKPVGLKKMHKRLFYTLDLFCGRFLQQKVIAVSGPLGHVLCAHFEPRHISVIDNGVDVEALRSAVRPVDFRISAPDAVHVGIVGRLEPVKRVDLFLGMCALLLQEAPERTWRFHIIGDGSLRGELERSAKTLGIEAAVTFHGHRSDSVACLAALDALVMCSDHEGMPMTPLESIAVGTPVVAHDVGGLSNILSAESGGILTRDHTAAGYARAVIALLNSDKKTLLEHGMARVRNEFSAARNAADVAALYRSLAFPATASRPQ